MKKLVMIAAAGEQDALGKDNRLQWHLPDDFKRFKSLTSGHKIIMGRKTFESFPKPLPNRTHLIISRNKAYKVNCQECKVLHSLEEAISLVGEDETAYIIGGGEIYSQGMAYADMIELTRVHGTFEADAYFPKIDENIWEVVKREYHPPDEEHAYGFTYLTYQRRKASNRGK